MSKANRKRKQLLIISNLLQQHATPVEVLHKGVYKLRHASLIETADGFRLTSTNPEFAKAMGVAEEGMREYREALGSLAK